ncbi:MAG: hypothetical protein V2B13_13200 [Pseudomonadota bacterium]
MSGCEDEVSSSHHPITSLTHSLRSLTAGIRPIGCSATEWWPLQKLGVAERPDLLGRLPKGVGQDASSFARRSRAA